MFLIKLSFEQQDEETEQTVDGSMAHLIRILFGIPKIVQYAECRAGKIDTTMGNFSNLFQEFTRRMHAKLDMPFEDLRKREKWIGKLYSDNEHFKKNITGKRFALYSLSLSIVCCF